MFPICVGKVIVINYFFVIRHFIKFEKSVFNKRYEKLNVQQRQAVDEIYGPVMVLAGPGTGKTEVIAMRIANILIKTDLSAGNILCLTFTNSGVRAMRQRLQDIIGPDAYKINIHTFHSFCQELINFYPERFLFARKIIQASDLDKLNLIKRILADGGWEFLRTPKSPDFYVGYILKAIGVLKQEGVSPERLAELASEAGKDLTENEKYYRKGKLMAKYQPKQNQVNKNIELAKMYAMYEKKMHESGFYDFNDMISFVLTEIRRDDSWRANLQEKYQFILVDEYQDTNGAQNELIELLGQSIEQPNIMVVGDDDQSIYRFQGANKENLLFFNDLYPASKKIVLDINYRSTEPIVSASQSLMAHSRERVAEDLGLTKIGVAANQEKAAKVKFGMLANEAAELNFISDEIKRLISSGVDPSQVAIFYRNNRDGDELLSALKAADIECYRLGGENLLNHVVVRQIKQIISLVSNFDNNTLWFEAMHFDCWQIEPGVAMRAVIEFRKSSERSFWQWLDENSSALDKSLAKMTETINNLRRQSANMNLVMWMSELIEQTGLLDKQLIEKKYDDLAAVKSFFDFVKSTSLSKPDYRLADFLADLDQMADYGIEIEKNQYEFQTVVNLMTAHGSKGLEFEYVFIYRAISHHWDNKRSFQPLRLVDGVLHRTVNDDQLEEERRLFYVAMTRAKKGLYITGAVNYFAQQEKENSPTVFMAEIDANFIENVSTDEFNNIQPTWFKIGDQRTVKELAETEKEVIRLLVADFSLSPTALNNYLLCPRKFLYDNLLKLPRAKTLSLSFGTAVHHALENFYVAYKKSLYLPDRAELLDFFRNALRQEGLLKQDRSALEKSGEKVLSGYYAQYHESMVRPVFNEFDFGHGRVWLDDRIPLAGKVDRVEFMSGSQERVRVIDYKTGKPKSRAAVTGKTKNDRGDYWRQLVFYQLLGDLSDRFVYQIAETEIDFVEPDDRGRYHRHQFSISSQDVNSLKDLIRDTWDKIERLEFGGTENSGVCTGGWADDSCDHQSYCRPN